MSETWRLFIALELPPDVSKTIEQTQSDLKRLVPSRAARWVRLEGIHLTLKFLGDVPVGQVDDLNSALVEAASRHRTFELSMQGMGCFPDAKRPRVLWLGVTGDMPQLRALQADVEKHISPLGYPPESRRFSPHLTLARADRRASREDLARLGKLSEDHDPGHLISWRVDTVSLMRSQLKPSGAVYTQIGHTTLEP